MPIPTSGGRSWCVLMRTAVGVLDFCKRISGSSTRLLAEECSVAVLRLRSELELGGEQIAPGECSVALLIRACAPSLCSIADSRPNLMGSTCDKPKYTCRNLTHVSFPASSLGKSHVDAGGHGDCGAWSDDDDANGAGDDAEDDEDKDDNDNKADVYDGGDGDDEST